MKVSGVRQGAWAVGMSLFLCGFLNVEASRLVPVLTAPPYYEGAAPFNATVSFETTVTQFSSAGVYATGGRVEMVTQATSGRDFVFTVYPQPVAEDAGASTSLSVVRSHSMYPAAITVGISENSVREGNYDTFKSVRLLDDTLMANTTITAPSFVTPDETKVLFYISYSTYPGRSLTSRDVTVTGGVLSAFDPDCAFVFREPASAPTDADDPAISGAPEVTPASLERSGIPRDEWDSILEAAGTDAAVRSSAGAREGEVEEDGREERRNQIIPVPACTQYKGTVTRMAGNLTSELTVSVASVDVSESGPGSLAAMRTVPVQTNTTVPRAGLSLQSTIETFSDRTTYFTVYITFHSTRDVNGFTAEDIIIESGSARVTYLSTPYFTPSTTKGDLDSVYSATVRPMADGNITITVPEDVVGFPGNEAASLVIPFSGDTFVRAPEAVITMPRPIAYADALARVPVPVTVRWHNVQWRNSTSGAVINSFAQSAVSFRGCAMIRNTWQASEDLNTYTFNVSLTSTTVNSNIYVYVSGDAVRGGNSPATGVTYITQNLDPIDVALEAPNFFPSTSPFPVRLVFSENIDPARVASPLSSIYIYNGVIRASAWTPVYDVSTDDAADTDDGKAAGRRSLRRHRRREHDDPHDSHESREGDGETSSDHWQGRDNDDPGAHRDHKHREEEDGERGGDGGLGSGEDGSEGLTATAAPTNVFMVLVYPRTSTWTGQPAGSISIVIRGTPAKTDAPLNYVTTGGYVQYTPGGAGSPARTTLTGPGAHDGSTPFAVELTWDPLAQLQAYEVLALGGSASSSFSQTTPTEGTDAAKDGFSFARLLVTPTQTGPVTVLLPANVASSPGNSRAMLTVPFDANAEHGPVQLTVQVYGTHGGEGLANRETVSLTTNRDFPGWSDSAVLDCITLSGARVAATGEASGPVTRGWTSTPAPVSLSSKAMSASFEIIPLGNGTVVVAVEADCLGSDPGNAAAVDVLPYSPPKSVLRWSLPDGYVANHSVPFLLTPEPPVYVSPRALRVTGPGRVSGDWVASGPGNSYFLGMLAASEKATGPISISIPLYSTTYYAPAAAVLQPAPRGGSGPVNGTAEAPSAHDGVTPFVVYFVFDEVVTGFTADDVTTAGAGRTGGLSHVPGDTDADGDLVSSTVGVQVFPDGRQGPIVVSLPANKVAPLGQTDRGSNPIAVTIPWACAGGGSTPCPSPSPLAAPCQGVTCSGHGTCVVASSMTTTTSSSSSVSALRGTPDYGAPYECMCHDGYTGYDCSFLPPATATCSNGVWDKGEADVDCGGPCRPCGPGFLCVSDADCGVADASAVLCASFASVRNYATFMFGDGNPNARGVCMPETTRTQWNAAAKVVRTTLRFQGAPKSSWDARVSDGLRRALQVGFVRLAALNAGGANPFPSNRTYGAEHVSILAVGAVTASGGSRRRVADVVQSSSMAGLTAADTGADVVFEVRLQDASDAPTVSGGIESWVASGEADEDVEQQLPGLLVQSVAVRVAPAGVVAGDAPADVAGSTATPTPTPTSGRSGGILPELSTGGIVGVAIAAFAVGVTLTGAVVYVCMRKAPGRRRRFSTVVHEEDGVDMELSGTPRRRKSRSGSSGRAVTPNPLDAIARGRGGSEGGAGGGDGAPAKRKKDRSVTPNPLEGHVRKGSTPSVSKGRSVTPNPLSVVRPPPA